MAILATVGWCVLWVLLAFPAAVVALAEPSAPEGFAERPVEDVGLVDEDEQYVTRETVYAFNPVQARNEFKVGVYYTKKGSHRAAAGRYLEATRWDSNYAEAYRRLGMARERLGEADGAADAYSRYLTLEPGGKRSAEVRKRLRGLRAHQLPRDGGTPGPGPVP